MTDNEKEEYAAFVHASKHQAKNLTELLEGAKSLSGKEYLNQAFQVLSVVWRASDIEGEGLPFFAVLTIVDAYGEEKKLSCGGRSVAEAIAIGDANGFFQPIADFAQWVKFVGIEMVNEDTGKPNGRVVLEMHITEAPGR